MKLKGLTIGDKIAQIPIIQGGMGVGVSLHRLAGAVAKAGGIGIISTADIGFKEPDFDQNPVEANLRAIDKEIKAARNIAPKGVIGVNIMVAMNHYAEIAKRCVKNGIDLIISGAGLPKELPELVKGTKTKIAPIISSAKGARLISKLWITKHNYVPDMIVVEGPEAGGHLGFKLEELGQGENPEPREERPTLEKITVEVVEEVKKIEQETGKEIPVVVAGGIFDGKDIARYIQLGANGVQMATRFVATEECDAADEFKQAYINCQEEDIAIIKSPVGMPGRAIRNAFIQKVEKEKEKITKCYGCIKTCQMAKTPYCITKALIESVKGNINQGLVFCGSNAKRIKEMTTVPKLIENLQREAEMCLENT
jgi:NAD(P)H-dependent flavin oxidoreductase YrpB (nitropropane dioxygenase family)